MKRTAAWVVVGLLIALCGSACGSLLFNGIPRGSEHVSTIFSTINDSLGPSGERGRILVSRSGSGKATLGTFVLHGKVHLSVSCTGAGWVVVEFVARSGVASGSGTFCPTTAKGGTIDGPYYGRTRIEITHAPARVNWTISIDENATN